MQIMKLQSNGFRGNSEVLTHFNHITETANCKLFRALVFVFLRTMIENYRGLFLWGQEGLFALGPHLHNGGLDEGVQHLVPAD